MRISILLLLTLLGGEIAADTVYVRGTLYVPLRGGQSTEHRILHRGLRSGTSLERLETNPDTGYTRVRTEDGLEGWLQTQYLVDAPIAADQLTGVTGELNTLEAEHQQTLLRFSEAREAISGLESSLEAAESERDALAAQLEEIRTLSADVLAINEQNQSLSLERDDLMLQIDELYEETRVGNYGDYFILANDSQIVTSIYAC